MPTTDAAALTASLELIAALPDVAESVEQAREACTRLRWHPALRRRIPEAAAETAARAVRASAALAGARYPVDMVRDVMRGAAVFPADAAGAVAMGAVRARAEVDRAAGAWTRSPAQVLARLHTVAAAGVVDPEALGRPRAAGEQPGDGADLLDDRAQPVPAPDGGPELAGRLAGVHALLGAPGECPAVVVAALVHAELATARPFVAGNGVVARALCRGLVVTRGLDPTAVCLWEAALLAAGPQYPLTLARYAQGGADGVGAWVRMFAQAVTDGAAEGQVVCDAVLTGRLTG